MNDTKQYPDPIQGALDQLHVETRPNGEVDHYLWGFDGDYDSEVWISKETYQRIRRFLLDRTENLLADIEGFMATKWEDAHDAIPFGARVSVIIDFEDPWGCVFVIEPAGDERAAVA